MSAPATTLLDRTRIAELTEREQRRLDDRTPGSRALYERARASLAGGVASAYQERQPWPIYLSHGKGSHVWDVDGTEMVDFHNAFGSMPQGHAHPAITDAVSKRLELGTHFAAPTEDAVAVAEELKRRWGIPRWRFVNSGSEATMDAIRIARAQTGRDTIVKIFGSYHGHHDYVMVSIGVPHHQIGNRENYASIPYGAGIPKTVAELTVPVPFNDAGAMERRIESLVEEGRPPACVIMEPAMMNLGVVLPEPGYLEAVREITRKHGVVRGSSRPGSGFVASLAHPGGNVTGMTDQVADLAAKAVQLLKETLPKIRRLALMWESTNPAAARGAADAQTAARSIGLRTLPILISNAEDAEQAFETAAKQRADAVIVIHTPLTVGLRVKIAQFALKKRLPLMSAPTQFAEAGALISYGTDLTKYFRHAAVLVDKILKGAKPADIPIEQPTKFELVVNMKTARKLGIEIPNSVLLRADRVIE